VTESGEAELKGLRETVSRFEEVITLSMREKHPAGGLSREQLEGFLRAMPVNVWNLLALFDAYVERGLPREHLGKFMECLMDYKLELYFVTEVDLGLTRQAVYMAGFDPKRPLATPRLLLMKLSLNQSVIGKVRILWERLMNAVYYLETGRELSSKQSKRTKFFNKIRDVPQWKPLLEVEALLERYENTLRTPEFHSASVLRAELLGSKTIDPNDLLVPLTPLLNGVWEMVWAAVTGAQPPIALGRRV